MYQHPNVHIRIFRKRWCLILGCFFPVSILKLPFHNTLSKSVALFRSLFKTTFDRPMPKNCFLSCFQIYAEISSNLRAKKVSNRYVDSKNPVIPTYMI